MKWIKVHEQPLPEDGSYLVYVPHFCESGYAIAEFSNKTFEWTIEDDNIIDSYVKQWMEIPRTKD